MAFLADQRGLIGPVEIPGLPAPLVLTEDWSAAPPASSSGRAGGGTIYRHIAAAKGEDSIITEVSMDETDSPQTPPELLVILAALAREGVPVQTIAPKFTGRFNKGVDYVGDLAAVRDRSSTRTSAVIAYAVRDTGCRRP